jgi:choline dehydrogenase-like flavoprotein
MIGDLHATGDAELEGDVCIVGAGAAGLALAAQFLQSHWRVIVLESGLKEPDARSEDLNVVTSVGLRHDGWREGRVRSFGGTTRAWGGQLTPMRASEVQARPWVQGSGWPLHVGELQPYYRRVEHLLRTEGPPYDLTVWPRLGIPQLELDPALLRVRFSQWAPLIRRNFAVLLRRALERAHNVQVLLDATAVAVRCTADGRHCESVEVCSRAGVKKHIRARWFVLACGGIETPRLLLASPSPGNRGVANSNGTVGRYFQDHISYRAGELEPAVRRRVQDVFDPRYLNGTMFSLKLEPTDQLMQRHGWLNAMAHIAFEIPDALGWMEVRRIRRAIQAGRVRLPSRDESLALARGAGELSKLVLTRLLAQRRLSPSSGRIRLLVDVEQAPDPDSRVLLDSTADCFGMPRARLDWRVGELERRTLTGFARTIAGEFERLGLGKVHLAGEPDFSSRDVPGAARDIFHHMGTTRMSRAATDGVTRHDLRCHDVDNLYIAGASVFPACGIANPTFTALALCFRLGDHLKARLRSPAPSLVAEVTLPEPQPEAAQQAGSVMNP